MVVEQATTHSNRSGIRVDSSYLLSGIDVVAGDAVTTALLGDGRGVEIGVDSDVVASDTLSRLDVVDERPFLWDKTTTGSDIGTTGGLFAAPTGLLFTADDATSAAYTFERAAPTESMDVAATMHVAGMPAVSSGVQSITVTNGGAYTTTPTVTLTGGGGSGATADVVMGRYLSPENMVVDGGSYGSSDVITVRLDPPIDGLAFEVVLNDLGGGEWAVHSATIINWDQFPSQSLPTVVFSESTRVGGRAASGATAWYEDEFGDNSWGVASIVVTNAGDGYASAPSVEFDPASVASATAIMGYPIKSVTQIVDAPLAGLTRLAAWFKDRVDIDGVLNVSGGVTATTITASGKITVSGGIRSLGGDVRFGSLAAGSSVLIGNPTPTFPTGSNIDLDVKTGVRAGDDIHVRDGLYVGDPGNNIFGMGSYLNGHLRTYGNLEVNPMNGVREGEQGKFFITTTANTTDTKFQFYTATDGLHIGSGGSETKTGVPTINLDQNTKVTGNMTATGDIVSTGNLQSVGAVYAGTNVYAQDVEAAGDVLVSDDLTVGGGAAIGFATPVDGQLKVKTLAASNHHELTVKTGSSEVEFRSSNNSTSNNPYLTFYGNTAGDLHTRFCSQGANRWANLWIQGTGTGGSIVQFSRPGASGSSLNSVIYQIRSAATGLRFYMNDSAADSTVVFDNPYASYVTNVAVEGRLGVGTLTPPTTGNTLQVTGGIQDDGAPIGRWRGTAASDPATPKGGDMYKNTGDSKVYIYTGAAWEALN